MGNRPTLRERVEAGAAANRAAMQQRAGMQVSQSGTFEETSREVKALIEQGLQGKEIVEIIWGKTVGVTQTDALVGVVDEIIGIKYDEAGEVQSSETLTGLILTRRAKIEEILQISQSTAQ